MSERPEVDAEKALSIIQQSLWAQKLYNEAMKDLAFFRTVPYIYVKITRWERFKWRMEDFAERAQDAWLVLIGRAHIDRGYDE